jgi:DHA1 family inner membrane transport protein
MASQTSVARAPAWLAGSFSSSEIPAALGMGSVGLLVLGLQPILLGAMFSEGKVDFDELALIATCEIIAIAIGSTLGGVFGIRSGVRAKATILLLALVGFNAASSLVSSLGAYIVLRSLAGLVEGALVVFAIELVARSTHAQRLGGYFVIGQTLLQAALALILALWVLPAWGSAGGFAAMAVVAAASIAIVPMAPNGYAPLPKVQNSLDGVFTLRAVLALLSIFAFFLFIGAVWAFLEPIGARSGIDAATVGKIVSAALVAQIIGALLSTWAADRMHYGIGIFACGLIALAAIGVILSGPTPGAFWAAALVIGFVWLFIIPCQVGMAVAADESRSTATLVPAANLLGAAIGPILASLFIAGNDVSGVVWFGLGAVIASFILLGLFFAVTRGRKGSV